MPGNMSEKSLKRSNKPGPSAIGKLYLLVYNGVQSLGWTYLLWQSMAYFLDRGTLGGFWSEIKWSVLIFQGGAVLEVIHALVGLVSSSFIVVLMQVWSRVFLVFAVLLTTEGAATSPGLPLCVLAWSITEIIRYFYYTLNLVSAVPQNITILRYSTFILLYPLGITGELLCMYHALDEIAEKKMFTVSMPNEWNFLFNYYYIMILYMLAYIPLFPFLFSHMVKQRRKVLGAIKMKAK